MARTSTNLTVTPWKKEGPAYNLARALLTSGVVGQNESACELQGSYKQFRDLNLKSFTSGLDRLKEELKMKPGVRYPKVATHTGQVGAPKSIVTRLNSDKED